ncbi:hypothetical protein L1987_12254 [Smallanthus sonchifolius]|uniref:Uncharacterized protein n=1 Tax=Smallanthus sonchifolius TaxID=185202 RepID=A0ACB9JE58_9ASTR|nr:hypothetical protein L1987_12254 [Smallanthus sonchifolius]
MTRFLLVAPSSHPPLSPAACRPPPKVSHHQLYGDTAVNLVTWVYVILSVYVLAASIISFVELKKHRSTAPTLVSWSRQSLSVAPGSSPAYTQSFAGKNRTFPWLWMC